MKPRSRPRRSTSKRGAAKLRPQRKIVADRRRRENFESLAEMDAPVHSFEEIFNQA